MPASLTEPIVANAALGYLNAAEITSLDEATPHAQALKRYWQLTRQSLLRRFDWTFARKAATLSALSGASLSAVSSPEYLYAYGLPADYLCARDALDGLNANVHIEYNIKPSALLTDAESVTLLYTADVEQVGSWDPAFCDAFAVAVAARAAKLITGSDSRATELQAMLDADFIAPAKIASSTESRPERDNYRFLPPSELVESRYTGI